LITLIHPLTAQILSAEGAKYNSQILSAEGAKYNSQGQAPSEARRVAPGN